MVLIVIGILVMHLNIYAKELKLLFFTFIFQYLYYMPLQHVRNHLLQINFFQRSIITGAYMFELTLRNILYISLQ